MLSFIVLMGLQGAYVDLSCHNQILEAIQAEHSSAFCRSSSLLDWSDGKNPFRKKIACQFPTQESLHVYQDEDLFVADRRNASEDLTVTQSCDDILSIVETMAEAVALPSPTIPPRPFNHHDSILIAASESTCRNASDLLHTLLQTYHHEDRLQSQLLCIPQSLVDRRNPSTIRSFMATSLSGVEGVVLVGTDIPPFEFFARPSGSFADYGESDLPYGVIESAFWNRPLSKKDPLLFNKIYFEKNNVHKVASPSPFAFDLETLVKADAENFSLTQPDKWVSRVPVIDRNSLEAFVTRRSRYQPHLFQNVVLSRGSNSMYFSPYDARIRDTMIRRMSRFQQHLPAMSQLQILESSLLEASLAFLDHETSFLVLDEHGNPGNIGDLSARSLKQFTFLPEIVHFDACLAGSWSIADDASQSILISAFSLREPPLAVLASQGIKYIPTIGSPDPMVSDIFFADIQPGMSLGQRQLENFSKNLQVWLRGEAHTFRRHELPAQLWHSLSLFGDGSVEF